MGREIRYMVIKVLILLYFLLCLKPMFFVCFGLPTLLVLSYLSLEGPELFSSSGGQRCHDECSKRLNHAVPDTEDVRGIDVAFVVTLLPKNHYKYV